MESPETFVLLKRWFLLKFRDKESEETKESRKSWIIPLAAVGLILVVAGIVVETYAEGQVSDVDALLRAHESDKISQAEANSASAIRDAGKAETSAECAAGAAARANDSADAAGQELKRMVGPIHTIPVIDGEATPDLSLSFTQRVLLTRDVRIQAPILPPMPAGGSMTWTLFLDQDSVGSHNASIAFIPKFDTAAGLSPNSRSAQELVTEANGATSSRAIPIWNVPIATATPKVQLKETYRAALSR